ncbi:MAG: inositol monophosphatase [Sedimentitalea sp.]
MREADLALLVDAARAAGEIATSFTGPKAKRWDKPDGGGPVTEADLAVNDMLADRLRAERPDYGWLSEETEDDSARLGCDRVFIIDPIDGTRSFAEGSSTWAHALAIAEKGVVTTGVVFLPLRGLMYTASAGQGAFLNDAPLVPSDRAELDGSDILTTKPNIDPKHWQNRHVPSFRRAHRPSLAYRMALVAQGRFDGMLTLRDAWEWDIAAGDLILREAGAQVSDATGAPLKFNNAHPAQRGVIAGGKAIHGAIQSALLPM